MSRARSTLLVVACCGKPGGCHALHCTVLTLACCCSAAVQETGRTGSGATPYSDGQPQDRGVVAAVPRTGTFQSFQQPLFSLCSRPYQPLLTSQPAAFCSCLLQLALHIYYGVLAMEKATCKRCMTWKERYRADGQRNVRARCRAAGRQVLIVIVNAAEGEGNARERVLLIPLLQLGGSEGWHLESRTRQRHTGHTVQQHWLVQATQGCAYALAQRAAAAPWAKGEALSGKDNNAELRLWWADGLGRKEHRSSQEEKGGV